jgi:hypothetical protein
LHYIDLFPEWPRGIRRLTGMLRREAERRRKRPATGRRKGWSNFAPLEPSCDAVESSLESDK